MIYAATSLAAIGVIALLIHRLGYSRRYAFEDDEAARDAFTSEFPDADIVAVSLSADGSAALLDLAGAETGLVRAMGRHIFARRLAPADIVQVSRDGTTLQLRLADYTDPAFSINLPGEQAARHWESKLTVLPRETA